MKKRRNVWRYRPLRKIVAEVGTTDGGMPIELLECGHKQRATTDYIGVTNAYARRCRECGKTGEWRP